MAERAYRRLPGTGYRRIIPMWAIVALLFVIGIFALLFQGRRIQLWEGQEHLLMVEWDGNREYYKRFSFRDIQAFILRKTNEGKIVGALLASVTALFGGLAFTTGGGFRIFLLCLAGFFGFFFAINTIFGPTCKCFVRTAVQSEELFSITRVRRFRQLMERIQPRIAQAQGLLTREELTARLLQARSPVLTSAQPQFVQDDPNAPPRIV